MRSLTRNMRIFLPSRMLRPLTMRSNESDDEGPPGLYFDCKSDSSDDDYPDDVSNLEPDKLHKPSGREVEIDGDPHCIMSNSDCDPRDEGSREIKALPAICVAVTVPSEGTSKLSSTDICLDTGATGIVLHNADLAVEVHHARRVR